MTYVLEKVQDEEERDSSRGDPDRDGRNGVRIAGELVRGLTERNQVRNGGDGRHGGQRFCVSLVGKERLPRRNKVCKVEALKMRVGVKALRDPDVATSDTLGLLSYEGLCRWSSCEP